MAATYALVPSTQLAAERGGVLDAGGMLVFVGTLSASGTYTTGGDTFPSGGSPEDVMKRIGAGRVLGIHIDGAVAQWDEVNKKMKLTTGTVPVAEIAGAAALASLNGAKIIIFGR